MTDCLVSKCLPLRIRTWVGFPESMRKKKKNWVYTSTGRNRAWYRNPAQPPRPTEVMDLRVKLTTSNLLDHCNFYLNFKCLSLYPQVSMALVLIKEPSICSRLRPQLVKTQRPSNSGGLGPTATSLLAQLLHLLFREHCGRRGAKSVRARGLKSLLRLDL